MAANWDATAQQKFKEYNQILVGLILGSIVLLPSIVGLTKPPFVIPWAVPLVLVLAAISAACLTIATLASVLGFGEPPFKLMGIGSWSGLAGLILMLAFVVLNIYGDLNSTPVVTAVKASPVSVAPDKYIDLDVEASDKSGDRLAYQWSLQGRVISNLRNGYLKAPTVPGTYQVKVSVTNGRNAVESTITIEVVSEPPKQQPAPSQEAQQHASQQFKEKRSGNSRKHRHSAGQADQGRRDPKLGYSLYSSASDGTRNLCLSCATGSHASSPHKNSKTV